MNRSAITALLGLRQYELEKEQWRLQSLQQQEMRMAALLEQAQNHLSSQMLVDPGACAMDWKRRSDGVRELDMELEKIQRHYGLAQQARQEQVQNVLAAKRRLETVERLLERDEQARRAARDIAERKLLDDLAVGRASQPEYAL